MADFDEFSRKIVFPHFWWFSLIFSGQCSFFLTWKIFFTFSWIFPDPWQPCFCDTKVLPPSVQWRPCTWIKNYICSKNYTLTFSKLDGKNSRVIEIGSKLMDMTSRRFRINFLPWSLSKCSFPTLSASSILVIWEAIFLIASSARFFSISRWASFSSAIPYSS